MPYRSLGGIGKNSDFSVIETSHNWRELVARAKTRGASRSGVTPAPLPTVFPARPKGEFVTGMGRAPIGSEVVLTSVSSPSVDRILSSRR